MAVIGESVTTVIGIDPGLKGGIAILPQAGPPQVYPMDDAILLSVARTYSQHPGVLVAVEKTHAMPQQGVTSQWVFGVQQGWIMGICAALNLPVKLIPPQTWKKYYNLLKTDKKESIIKAKSLYPGVCLRRNRRCRTDSDGMAEALLIGHFAKMEIVSLK